MEKAFKGLRITVPHGAVCGLYPGAPASMYYFEVIDPQKAIPVASVDVSNGLATYHYPDLEPGLYHCGASMEGYSALCQMIHYTASKAENGMQLDMQLDKLSGNGYEQGYVMRNTREFVDAQMLSHNDAWGAEYAKLFQTPWFLRNPGSIDRHRQTTNEEMMDFIAQLAAVHPCMHVFSLGTSPKYGYDMPLVLFTREAVAGKTLEQAAGVIRNNGKPTVQYIAQCHSREPISTEGALAMMLRLCGDYGERVLDRVDVYIIPRINLDGAPEVRRVSPTTGEDMNRDYLYMHNQETRMVAAAYNLFLPEVAIDGHEKMTDIRSAGNALCTDMELQVGAGSLNHPAIMTETAMKMALLALEKGRDLGLRTHFYTKLASAAGGTAGSSYFGTRNSLSFLVETPGQAALGGDFIHRRVLGQYVLASTVISYTAQHSQEVMDIVHASREKMVRTGAVYDESDVIVLEHGKAETGAWATPLIHVPTGAVVEPDHSVAYSEHVVALKTRPRPTAYVLPVGLANEAQILRVTENHAIPHYRLPEGSAVMLRQYLWDGEQISLTQEQTVDFPQGAYVFPNTVSSVVLGVIMEPDFNRISGRKMTLMSMGLVEADENGCLPVFRYCHDLTDGKIMLQ